MEEKVVEIKGLKKSFGEFAFLQGVDLRSDKGEKF